MDKKHQRFLKGMNKDVNPSLQPDDTYRDAVNMDISLQGDEAILNTIKSISEATSVNTSFMWATPEGTASASNILGITKGIGKISGNDEDCVVVFVSGTNTTPETVDTIFVYGTRSGLLESIRDTNWDTKLNFNTGGNISAFVTRDRGRSFVFFTDGFNPIRRFQLDSSVMSSYTSAEQLDLVRSYPSDGAFSGAGANISVETNGSLIGGTYQFSYRLKNSATGALSKWTTLSNPVPIIPESTSVFGAEVGEVTNKSINITIATTTEEEAAFDEIELASVKNTTGQVESQGVVFVSTYTIDTSAPTEIIYDGTNAEFELPIGEVVVDDAAIESAVAGWETNGRTIFGNVSYFDRRLADNEGVVTNAETITEEVDYSVEQNCKDKRGYFRDEVYRFGIVYHDKYGNWSPVKPIDFSDFKATTPTNTALTITSIVQREKFNSNNYTNNKLRFNVSSGADTLTAGTMVRANFGTATNPDFRYYYVVETGGSTIVIVAAYEDVPTLTPSVTELVVCLGEKYSHSASNDWKFNSRETPTGNVRGVNFGRALGLRMTIDGTTHPSWATGMAIVRMQRDRNVVYQAPLIPAALRSGVITPGKNTITQRDYNRDSNGIGEFDHLAPKIFQMGVARGFGVGNIQGNPISNNPPLSYEFPQWRNTETTFERWPLVFGASPDFVANTLGRPLVNIPEDETLDVKVVDLVGLTREVQTNAAGAKVYVSDDADLYFYNGGQSNYKFLNTATSNYVDVALPRIQDTIVSIDNSLQQRVFDITNIRTNRVIGLPNNSAPIQLPQRLTSSINAQAVRLNAGSDLVNQQRTSTTSIPADQIPTEFTGDVVTQRALGIELDTPYLDPLYQIATRYNTGSVREVFWSQYVANPAASGPQIPARLYNNTALGVRLRGQTGSAPWELVGFEDRIQPSNISNGDIANAVIVANIEAGKSDFRYGSPERGQEYIFTGAYAPITDSSNITFDVWGGDCFVTKMTYRVNDSICIPRPYNPVAGTDITFGAPPSGFTATVAKTGVGNQQPEFIELWMEAESNFNFIADRERFPVRSRNIFDYTARTAYDYNFGYSIQNNAKRFFSEDRSVEFVKNFPARIVFSDSRVIGTNDDGYSRFRALNFKDLEEKYGAIGSFAELPSGDVLAFQDMAIRNLQIGKTTIQDEDGRILAISSGEFIANYITYITTNYGSQNPRLVLSTEFGVYALDKRNGTLLKISDGLNLLPLGRMESFFNEKYSNKQGYADANLALGYDQVAKEVHVIGFVPTPTIATNWLVYNEKYGAWVTRLDYTSENKSATKPYFVTSVGGQTYLIQTQLQNNYWSGGLPAHLMRIGRWRGGNTFGTILFGSTPMPSELEYVFNEAPDEFKVIDIVGVNSVLPFTSFTVTGHNEGGASETTGVVTTEIQQRNGMTFAPLIRDNVTQGRVRGVFAIVKLIFNQTNAANKIYSAFTQFRKSFR